ncbi:lytic transglycosylase, partial [Sinorhizobium meliloti]
MHRVKSAAAGLAALISTVVLPAAASAAQCG